MKESELSRMMSDAAAEATAAAIAAGHSRSSETAKRSAFSAAQAVYHQHRGFPDHRRDRMEREPEELPLGETADPV